MRQTTLVFLAVLVTVLLAGCGGNNSRQSSSKQAHSGRATFTIKWPVTAKSVGRSRLIPDASNSIKVEIKNGAASVTTQVLPRPASGGSSTATFDPLPVGNLTMTATAYPQADGAGTAQASAISPLTIVADQNTPISLTMATTIDHIEISPAVIAVPVGATQTLLATAKDASGAVVLLAATQSAWDTVNKTVATVSATGTLTGVAAGSTQVSYTDRESGKTVSAQVTVRANAPVGFAAPLVYTVPHASDVVTAADLDNDGSPDVIVGGSTELGVLYGKGDGTLEPYRQIATSSVNITNREVADLDGDGRPDIVFTDSSGNLNIVFNQGGRQFGSPVTIVLGNPPSSLGIVSSLYIGDLNGDAHPDIIVGVFGDGGSGSVSIYLNNGDGTFHKQSSFTHGGIVEGVYAVDVNGDGLPDLAVTFETSTVGQSGVTIYYGNGQGSFQSGPTYNVGTQNMNSPVFADFNGDGKKDLALCNYWGNAIVVFMNAGNGTFINPTRYFSDSYPIMLRVADFNGTGNWTWRFPTRALRKSLSTAIRAMARLPIRSLSRPGERILAAFTSPTLTETASPISSPSRRAVILLRSCSTPRPNETASTVTSMPSRQVTRRKPAMNWATGDANKRTCISPQLCK